MLGRTKTAARTGEEDHQHDTLLEFQRAKRALVNAEGYLQVATSLHAEAVQTFDEARRAHARFTR